MRTGGVPLAALLLVLASTVLQVSSSGDIYLEGEEDASNEYLEVKRDDFPIFDKLRQSNSSNVFEMFGSTEKQAEDATENILTDDSAGFGKDDDSDNFGSGLPEKVEPEPREKTLRVTFSVFEPYIPAYSNRDSQEFLNISRSLANAVDLLFDSLPGTQRSSLVRIQSLVNDDFWCKVTLDIVTSGYENMINIKDILRNHIKNNGRLGNTIVRDDDFSANVIDPECAENELQCDEYVCQPMSIKCDGNADCRDGTDEFNCPEPNLVGEAARNPNNYNNDYESTSDKSVNNEDNDDSNKDFGIGEEDDDDNTIYVPDVVLNPSSSEQSDLTTTEDNVISRGDQGETDVLPTEPWDDNQESTDADIDEITESPEDLTTKRNYITDSSETDCDDDYMRCDATRCVELSKRCDGINDCADATDEAGCPAAS